MESKVQLWWQQVLLIFLRTNVIFCTKQPRYRTAGPVPHRAAPYKEFFSWGSRHSCPMEVGACAQQSSGACSYQSISTARAELQQTRCTSLLLPVDGTDGRTDGHPTVTQTLAAYAGSGNITVSCNKRNCRYLRKLCPLHKPTRGYR